MANTLKLGAGKWATGTDTVLAFNDENNNFKPLPFSFSRASSATVVNQSGLIETVGSGTPRIDFKDDAKGALLLEPSRTNLWTESEGTSIILNSPLGEFGFYTLKNSQISRTISASDPISFTFIVKKIDGTIPTITSSSGNGDLVIYVGGGSSAGLSGVLTNIGDGFYKFKLTGYSNSGTGIEIIQNKSGVDTYVSLIQFEVGSYATSYIPTSGSAVTRIAETCNNGANSQVINSTEGVLYAEISAIADDSTLKSVCISDSTTTNRVIINYSNQSNRLTADVRVGAVGQAFMQTFNFTITNFLKIAVKYKANDFALWVNGTEAATDNSGITFSANTLNNLSLDNGAGGEDFYGKIKDIRIYNQALTDAELQALTTI